MIAEAEKINFEQECRDLVREEVYMDMTFYMQYLRKTEDWWEGNDECPVTSYDLECKDWNEEECEYDDEWLCAYAVSHWLANDLYDRGEIVARFEHLPCIWFRRTFGQAILLDAVIQDITRDLLVLRGKCSKKEAAKLRIG